MLEVADMILDEDLRIWRARNPEPVQPPAYMRIGGPEPIAVMYDGQLLEGSVEQSAYGGIATLDVRLVGPRPCRGVGIIFPDRYEIRRNEIPGKGLEWRLVEHRRPTAYAIRLGRQELIFLYELYLKRAL